MSCFRPYAARCYVLTGEFKFGEGPNGTDSYPVEFPCGSCIGCKMARARMWSIRITHEAQLYDQNLFVTLTYDDAHLKSASLVYEDFQGFMKRLRARIKGVSEGPDGGNPIRFFCSGEYGERNYRPHFHAILFNCWFRDQVRFTNETWRSRLCEDIWGRGSVVIGSVTGASAAYVAGYCLKKMDAAFARDKYHPIYVDKETGEIYLRRPEFARMSLRPGLGAWWYRKFGADVFPGDFAVADGKKFKVPRYYWEMYKAEGDKGVVEEIQYRRYLRALMQKEESSPERRAVREELEERRARFYERNL